MKKRRSSILAIVLAILLLLSACSGDPSSSTADSSSATDAPSSTVSSSDEVSGDGDSAAEPAATSSDYPEYLNLDSDYPVIKDEFVGQYKPRLTIVQEASGGDWDELWISQYLKEKYNLEFEVESILNTARAERKNLMFAADDLPDMMMSFELSAPEIYRYGQMEGQLLKCDEYINETLTPNLYRYYSTRDDVVALSTTPDGHVYTLPMITDPKDEGAFPRTFVNKAWLDELGIEMPRTLDEFTAMLYAVKEADPAGVGSENVYPLGGGSQKETISTSFYLLAAFGYVTDDPYGHDVTLRNGEVVIPAYDPEVFGEYLKVMNQYYTDGIINKNYYTMESTETIAQLNGGQTAVYRDPVYVTGLPTWSDWAAQYPLTSEWSSTPVWKAPESVRVGQFAISSKTEYPELCMRFADIYYNNVTDGCRALWVGPGEQSEYNYGYVNAHWNFETNSEDWDTSSMPEGVDLWTYLMQYLSGLMPQFGAFEDEPGMAYHAKMLGGERPAEKSFNMENADQNYRATVYANIVPYGTQSYPNTYYVEDSLNDRILDLKTLIDPYVKEQVALFVTGQRPLDQVDAFAEELKGMGAEELLTIYKEIYENYKAAMQ
ncbi:MAG: hypothetical protein ACK5LX_00035 [Oscillospiraceae bacterium]